MIIMTAQRLFIAVCLVATLSAQAQPAGSPAGTLSTLRATELRADKLAAAPVLTSLPVGAVLRLISAEGGWLWVETAAPTRADQKLTGWVRASAVNWQAGAAATAELATGRQAGGNAALTLGVRSLPARANRHALIIGISRYADATTPPLPGARIDRESATQMARAMQVPLGNIRYLQDEQATGTNIRQALRELNDKVEEGDRVFIHYSGHGTRYNDAAAGGCVEALLAYDGGQSGIITNREMSDLLKPMTNKTDKLFVMYDACHSGGLVPANSPMRTRGMSNPSDEGLLRPKFANISDECGRPVNIKTRNLLVEATNKGALPQDIIHVSASRDNEISFDDELKGGLATQYMRDCMLRDAKDLDQSGAISINEIRQCAQEKIDRRMANDPNFKPHNLVLSGNDAFVPAWFSQARPEQGMTTALALPSATSAVASALATQVAAAASTPAAASAVAAPGPSTPAPAPVPVPTPTAAATPPPPPPPPLTGEQALRQMFTQRDGKRRVEVVQARSQLKIGVDALDFSVRTDRAGFVYVALAGSDNKSVYMLFPNELDGNNRIEADQTLRLPRPNWRVKAGGPAGVDHLLVLVADGPRDLQALAASKAGPFMASLNDAGGRASLGALMTTSATADGLACQTPTSRRNNPQCSDAYGAALLTVEEIP